MSAIGKNFKHKFDLKYYHCIDIKSNGVGVFIEITNYIKPTLNIPSICMVEQQPIEINFSQLENIT